MRYQHPQLAKPANLVSHSQAMPSTVAQTVREMQEAPTDREIFFPILWS
jgi:hypothetical protein